jgi:hypothetical protein
LTGFDAKIRKKAIRQRNEKGGGVGKVDDARPIRRTLDMARPKPSIRLRFAPPVSAVVERLAPRESSGRIYRSFVGRWRADDDLLRPLARPTGVKDASAIPMRPDRQRNNGHL